MPAATERLAPAKVNLALHVTGRRADGYHLLDSITAFADFGDRLGVAPAASLSLTVTGPLAAGVPLGPENSVLAAAAALGRRRGAAITLEKRLPHAAGLGGGSADAAAALRALADLWQAPLPPPERVLALGADVPACLEGRAVRMRGIGELLSPLCLPPLPALLVNPGVPLATAAVFAALSQARNPPLPPPPDGGDRDTWLGWLASCRNDLQPPALALAPEIGAVLRALEGSEGARLARMSGSGASCFALYDSPARACAAEAAIAAAHPGWWCRAVILG